MLKVALVPLQPHQPQSLELAYPIGQRERVLPELTREAVRVRPFSMLLTRGVLPSQNGLHRPIEH